MSQNSPKNKTVWLQGPTLYGGLWMWGGIFLVLAIGVTAGFYFERIRCTTKSEYINKAAVCTDKVIDKRGYVELKDELKDYFESEKSLGHLTDAAVYFRDLNNGPVFGINEQMPFISASLLKLPVAMAVFKVAEDDPEILSRTVVNEGQTTLSQNISPEEALVTGGSYNPEELALYSLAYSDNTANELLKEVLRAETGNDEAVVLTFKELGLILPQSYLDEDISTRAYASLFRLLYNSSYLNEEYSEKLLSILTQSRFFTGLHNSVPSDVVIAHKFGERSFGEEIQLHDCGIVYYPRNPYIVCVMTRGDDFAELENVIKTVSEMLYEEVDSRRLD